MAIRSNGAAALDCFAALAMTTAFMKLFQTADLRRAHPKGTSALELKPRSLARPTAATARHSQLRMLEPPAKHEPRHSAAQRSASRLAVFRRRTRKAQQWPAVGSG